MSLIHRELHATSVYRRPERVGIRRAEPPAAEVTSGPPADTIDAHADLVGGAS
jgi:hypothetical protein